MIHYHFKPGVCQAPVADLDCVTYDQDHYDEIVEQIPTELLDRRDPNKFSVGIGTNITPLGTGIVCFVVFVKNEDGPRLIIHNDEEKIYPNLEPQVLNHILQEHDVQTTLIELATRNPMDAFTVSTIIKYTELVHQQLDVITSIVESARDKVVLH